MNQTKPSGVREEILGAVARGWCSKENEKKVMDPELAIAIAKEVEALFNSYLERERKGTLEEIKKELEISLAWAEGKFEVTNRVWDKAQVDILKDRITDLKAKLKNKPIRKTQGKQKK